MTTLAVISLQYIPILSLGIFLLSVEIGYRIGYYQSKKKDKPKGAGLSTSTGALLGLLAFMLTFTFGLAGSRFETRKNIVLEEANAIGTTYLRAAYLPEPSSSEIRRLLKEYTDMRIDAAKTLNINYAIAKSDELQDLLWAQATKIAETNPTSVMVGLFIQSLNEVIDIHTKRVMIFVLSPIPLILWIILFLLGILSMGSLGYLSGVAAERNHIINCILILAFASVIYLIADLDRPSEGEFRVSQQALTDLQKKMTPPAAVPAKKL